MSNESVVSAIKKAKTIAIISHMNPDGDTVGSSLALYKAIKMYGGEPYIFCSDQPKGNISTLKYVENYNTKSLDKYDLSIAVDCASEDRLADMMAEYKKGRHTAIIDHHKTNNGFADYCYIAHEAAATAQIMYNVINSLGVMDDEIASLLYTGLVTDSGGFTYSSVTPDTMRVAGELLHYDIKAHLICEKFLKSTTMNKYKLKTRVLSAAKFYEDGQVGVITFRAKDFDETGTDNSATEGIINNIRNIEGVRVAIAISEVKDKDFKVSIRTDDSIDSTHIVYLFGGGGHKNAAGCRLSGYYEDVLDKLLKAARDEL